MTKPEAKKVLTGLLDAFDQNEHGDYFYNYGWEVCEALIFAMEAFNEPSTDVASVVHGKWEKNSHVWDEIPSSYCSCCGQEIADECIRWFKYCSNCGARMDGE